ncbi:proline-rich protein 2-like [Phocoena sinus]|uniref:proline-rich protein 2-like n=1 Tax=Phocoena sinus TaxID=42100 RepID=UPI0013C47505|nr:proline-rich protein 2-like [Phocoena sinus]
MTVAGGGRWAATLGRGGSSVALGGLRPRRERSVVSLCCVFCPFLSIPPAPSPQWGSDPSSPVRRGMSEPPGPQAHPRQPPHEPTAILPGVLTSPSPHVGRCAGPTFQGQPLLTALAQAVLTSLWTTFLHWWHSGPRASHASFLCRLLPGLTLLQTWAGPHGHLGRPPPRDSRSSRPGQVPTAIWVAPRPGTRAPPDLGRSPRPFGSPPAPGLALLQTWAGPHGHLDLPPPRDSRSSRPGQVPTAIWVAPRPGTRAPPDLGRSPRPFGSPPAPGLALLQTWAGPHGHLGRPPPRDSRSSRPGQVATAIWISPRPGTQAPPDLGRSPRPFRSPPAPGLALLQTWAGPRGHLDLPPPRDSRSSRPGQVPAAIWIAPRPGTQAPPRAVLFPPTPQHTCTHRTHADPAWPPSPPGASALTCQAPGTLRPLGVCVLSDVYGVAF